MKGQNYAARIKGRDDTLFTLLRGDHVFEKHTHETYSIGIMLAGYSSFTRDRKTDLLHRGKLFIANPEDVHTCECGRDAKEWAYANIYPTLSFMQELGDTLDLHGAKAPLFPKACTKDDLLEQRLQRLFRKVLRGGEVLDVESELTDILSRLIITNADRSQGRLSLFEEQRPREILRVLEYLNSVENLGQVRLQTLARIAGFSPYHFIRTFQKTVGMTPYAYAGQLRVSRAQKLLVRGCPLSMAAVQSGFSDQSHMTRAFKKIYGVTPGKFIRKF